METSVDNDSDLVIGVGFQMNVFGLKEDGVGISKTTSKM